MAVIEGTNTNLPQQKPTRKDIIWIHKAEWKNSDERIDRNILHNLHGTTETL